MSHNLSQERQTPDGGVWQGQPQAAMEVSWKLALTFCSLNVLSRFQTFNPSKVDKSLRDDEDDD